MKKIISLLGICLLIFSCNNNCNDVVGCPVILITLSIEFIDADTGENFLLARNEEDILANLQITNLAGEPGEPVVFQEDSIIQDGVVRLEGLGGFGRIVFLDEFDVTVTYDTQSSAIDTELEECCGPFSEVINIAVEGAPFELLDEVRVRVFI